MSNIHVFPTILAWAAERLDTSLEGLAADMATPKRVDSFMSGTLTLSQASVLARKLHIPFGFLFLESPPKDETPRIPDLRQTQQPEPLSLAFYEVLENIKNKIDWHNAVLNDVEANELAFVGKYKSISGTTSRNVAKDIASTIGFSDNDRNGCKDSESLYNLLASKFEAVRILVFRSGFSENTTKRSLAVTEFRGFAIADKMCPAIFINGGDAPAARTFTLVHEAAHIWLGQSGVSDSTSSHTVESYGVEAFCNEVAAELLTPKHVFLKLWEETSEAKIATLASHFKVSGLVIARRAFDFGLIDREEYQEIHPANDPKKSENISGDSYASIPIRSSQRFTDAVVNSAMTGETMLRDAGRLLNIKPGAVVELYKRRRDILTRGTGQTV